VGLSKRASVVAFAFFAVTRPALADDKAFATLSYSAAEHCPDETSFRDQVNARLGYDPFVADAPRRVDVSITSEHGKLVGSAAISTSGNSTTPRELNAKPEQCGALVTALATTIAIELDAIKTPRQYWTPPNDPPLIPADSATQAPTRGETATAPSPKQAPAATPLTPANPISLTAFAGLEGSLGVAPGPTFGAELGASLGKSLFSVELSGRAETMFAAASMSSGDRVQASLFSGALGPCLTFDRVGACALFRLGAFEGRAATVQNPSTEFSPFAAIAARVSYALPLAIWLALRGGFELGVPLVRTALDVDNRSIWTAPPVFGAVSLSLVVKFQ
jgi:hypothetical protein